MAGDKKVVIKINLPTSDNKNSVAGSSVREVTEWNTKRLMSVGLILLLMLGGLLYLLTGSDSAQDEIINTVNLKNESIANATKFKPSPEINEAVSIKEKPPQPAVVETEKPLSVSESDIDQTIQADGDDRNNAGELNNEISSTSTRRDVDINKTQAQEKPVVSQWVVRAQLTKNINKKEPAGNIELPFVVNTKRARALFYFTELKNMQGKSVYHQWKYNGKIVFKKKINILGNRWRASTRKMISYRHPGGWNVRLLDDKGQIMDEISFTVVIED